jgi:hypothetical protein
LLLAECYDSLAASLAGREQPAQWDELQLLLGACAVKPINAKEKRQQQTKDDASDVPPVSPTVAGVAVVATAASSAGQSSPPFHALSTTAENGDNADRGMASLLLTQSGSGETIHQGATTSANNHADNNCLPVPTTCFNTREQLAVLALARFVRASNGQFAEELVPMLVQYLPMIAAYTWAIPRPWTGMSVSENDMHRAGKMMR